LVSCSVEPAPDCTLQENQLYSRADFPVGVAVAPAKLLPNSQYQKIVSTQFNSITPENIFKPQYLHPFPNVFVWDAADALAEFCATTNKRLHGHTLVWHDQLPPWIEEFHGTTAEWDTLLKNHIQTIVRHFRGKVHAWDVVNEAFNADGTLRNSVWKQNLGAGYIEKAFRYAHAADPKVKLFYNDFNLAISPNKRKAILRFLNTLKLRGVPIDGIGSQMHIAVGFPENSEITKSLMEIYQSDYLVHISELDISVNPFSQDMKQPSEKLLQRQADKAAFIANIYRQIPQRYQYGITWWGVGDQDSWIPSNFDRDDFPLLFDEHYQPKPVYCQLLNVL
jgi:endo-1,4-beta-xylanase